MANRENVRIPIDNLTEAQLDALYIVELAELAVARAKLAAETAQLVELLQAVAQLPDGLVSIVRDLQCSVFPIHTRRFTREKEFLLIKNRYCVHTYVRTLSLFN